MALKRPRDVGLAAASQGFEFSAKDERFAGGIPGGLADCAPAVNAGIAFCKPLGTRYDGKSATITLPRGRFYTDGPIDLTGFHGGTIRGEGYGATLIEARGNFPVFVSNDPVTSPLQGLALEGFQVRGGGALLASADGVRLGPNNGCRIDVAVYGARRGIVAANSWQLDLGWLRISAPGGLACYDGLVLDDGVATETDPPGERVNAVKVNGGVIQSCLHDGIRAYSFCGSRMDNIEVVGAGNRPYHFGESPQGNDVKWLELFNLNADTCGYGALFKASGSEAVRGRISVHFAWIGNITFGAALQAENLNKTASIKVDEIELCNYGLLVKGCVGAAVTAPLVSNYDRASLGSAAHLIENTTDSTLYLGVTRSFNPSIVTCLAETGASARNNIFGLNGDGNIGLVDGGGSRTIGCRIKTSGVSINLPDNVPEVTAANLPAGGPIWRSREFYLTNSVRGHRKIYCDNAGVWRYMSDDAAI